MTIQFVPSLTSRAHLPAVSAKIAVPAVAVSSGTTFDDAEITVNAAMVFRLISRPGQPEAPPAFAGGDHSEAALVPRQIDDVRAHHVSAVTRTMFVPSLRTMACFSVATVIPVPVGPMNCSDWPVPL